LIQSDNIKALIVGLIILIVALGLWESATRVADSGSQGELSEYEMMTGGGSETAGAGIPPPSDVIARAVQELSDPFYDNGPNDKGIGTQLAYSVARVLAGYSFAVILAVPLGFLIGMSPIFQKALNPYIQILRPISPLAWMPLALFIIQDSIASAVFVIFICSVWPILTNMHRQYSSSLFARSGRFSPTRRLAWRVSAKICVTSQRRCSSPPDGRHFR